MGVTLPPELATLLHEAGGRWPEADEDQLHELADSWRAMGERLEGIRADGDAIARSVTGAHRGDSIEAFAAHWSKIDERIGLGAVASRQTAVAVDGLAQATLDTKSAVLGVLSAAHAQRETMSQASAGMVGPLLRLLLPLLRKHISTILAQAAKLIQTVITALLKAIGRVFRAIGDFFGRLFGKRPPKPPPKPVYRRGEPLPHARELIRNGQELAGTGGRGGVKFPYVAQPNQVLFRRNPQTGDVSRYSVYDESGYIIKRVDLEGKPHNGMEQHTHLYRLNHNQRTGKTYTQEHEVREAFPGEIP